MFLTRFPSASSLIPGSQDREAAHRHEASWCHVRDLATLGETRIAHAWHIAALRPMIAALAEPRPLRRRPEQRQRVPGEAMTLSVARPKCRPSRAAVSPSLHLHLNAFGLDLGHLWNLEA